MNVPLPQPGRGALAAELAEVAASFAAFSEAMHGVNDEALIAAFRDLLAVAPPIIASHQKRIGSTLADDMATLNSLVARYPIPREDPDLGRTERLKALRAARGNLVADIESVLVAAKALGLVPSRPEIELPPAIVVERVGQEGLLSGLLRRLNDVEQGLRRIEAEKLPETPANVRQNGLINLYVGSMEIELALAKLEASAKKLIDLSGLGRAIEAIGTLTTDFIATTKGMVRSIGTGLRDAAKALAPAVGRLVGGMSFLAKRLTPRNDTGAPAKALLQPAYDSNDEAHQSNDDDALFWSIIEAGKHQRTRGWLARARQSFLEAETIARRATNIIEVDLPPKLAQLTEGQREALRLVYTGSTSKDIARVLNVSPHNIDLWLRTAMRLLSAKSRIDAARLLFNAETSNKMHRNTTTAAAVAEENFATKDLNCDQWQNNLSVSQVLLGDLARDMKDVAEARRRFSISVNICKRLVANNPNNNVWQRELADNHYRLGEIARACGDFAEARSHFAACVTIAEHLTTKEPDNSAWQRGLWLGHRKIGDVAEAEGDIDAAIVHFRSGLPIIEAIAAQSPKTSQWQEDLAYTLSRLDELERKAVG